MKKGFSMSSSGKVKVLVGSRIRSLRKLKKMSLEELAESARMHTTYLGDIERAKGNATITSLAKIADALNVQLYDLFKIPTVADDDQIIDNFKRLLKEKEKLAHLKEAEWILKDLFS